VRPSDAPAAQVRGVCLGDAAAAIVTSGDTLTVVDADASGHARKVTSTELHGLVWAAPIADEGDREAIAAISEARGDELVDTLTVLRLEAGKLVRGVDEPVYRLSRTNAQWIGARLEDLRLYLSVESRADSFVVGGALLDAPATGVSDLAPLKPVSVARHHHPAVEVTEPDAGVREPRDAGIR